MIRKYCPGCKLEMNPDATYPYERCPPCIVRDHIFAVTKMGMNVLDLGAGMARYHQDLSNRLGQYGSLTLVDAHLPYLLQNPVAGPALIQKVNADVTRIIHHLDPKSFDLVLCIDFLEHLNYKDVMSLTWFLNSTNRFVVLVPEGDHPQDTDAYEMGADHWQTHRTTWTRRVNARGLSEVWIEEKLESAQIDSRLHFPGPVELQEYPHFHAPSLNSGALFITKEKP